MTLLLLACATEAPEPELAPIETVELEDNHSTMVEEPPRYTQGLLESRSDGVRVSGQILCDQAGPWTVRVYPKHFDAGVPVQGQLPTYGHLSEVTVDQAGDFELLTTVGTSRRFIAFREAEDGSLRLAFSDAHASFIELRGHLSGLVLDCSIEPTSGHTEGLGQQTMKQAPERDEAQEPQDLDWLYESHGEELGDHEEIAAFERNLAQLEERYGRERVADLAPLMDGMDLESDEAHEEIRENLPVGFDD